MLHKLKPVPRGLLILAFVGIIGYVATQMDLSKVLPKKEAEPTVPVTVVTPPAPSQAAMLTKLKRDADELVQHTSEAPSGLTAAPSPDAGLDAVLGAGKKVK